MASLETLPADRRAVLSLLLERGKTYDELAGMLALDAESVRERAHDALERLGPRDASLSAERRADVADYLLGQQTASERADTRVHLGRSAAARAWARVVAGQLRPLGGAALPEIPAEGAEVDEAFDALRARRQASADVERSSRIGGVLLLAGLGVLVALIVLIATGVFSGSSSKHSAPSSTASATTPTSATTTAAQPQVVGQVNLRPLHGGKALGIANLLTLQGQLAVAMQAQGLQPTTSRQFYAVWLSNSGGDSQRLGFAPPVARDGRLQATATLTHAQSRFRQLLITRESARAPSRPGNIVLAGAISIPAQ